MNNYKSRPKINSKIIFNDILSNTNTALVIGMNNSDIIAVLQNKKITTQELNVIDEDVIIDYLKDKNDKDFDVIIFNLELSNYRKLNTLIPLLTDKSIYAIIRYRNKNRPYKTTKKHKINKIIKDSNINILKRLYVQKNIVSKSIFFKFFAYCTVLFITRHNIAIHTENILNDKIKKIIFNKKEIINLSINKK